MRFPVKLSAVLSVLLLLYGCDSGRYQIVTSPDGSLYRFNKKTGELSMLMEDKRTVRSAESQRSKVIKDRHEFSLERPIDWGESKYPGKDLKVKFETVWRENKLCYKFTAYPYKSLERIFARKKQDYVYSLMKPGFTIEILDKNGFMVKEIKINLLSMTKVDGDDGNAKELVINSQTDCTGQSYKSIGGYTVRWTLDGDMLENDKELNPESSPAESKKQ